MGLKEYKEKRKFEKTPEPQGKLKGKTKAKVDLKSRKLSFVVQEHHATRLHYDFRLELDGTLKSWAVPKGPSMKAGEKRLAMHVEDHPLEYGKFEGTIPKGNYGAGKVKIWDKGLYVPVSKKGYYDGDFKFVLVGKKLKGGFALIKMKNGKQENAWLLIKHKDEYAK